MMNTRPKFKIKLPKCSVSPGLINVGDSSKKRTKDDLGVVFEEVYLHGSIGQVHHHGSAGSEPGLEGGNTGQLVFFSHLDNQYCRL